MDLDGYKRLSRLLSRSATADAAKGECDLTFDDLAEHTPRASWPSSCRRAELDDPAFHERLRALARLFGAAAISPAPCCSAATMRARLAQLDNLAAEMGVGLVATNDVHYHVPERRALQDVVTAIRLGCTVDELGFRRFASAERHLKTAKEMARLFRRHPRAIERIAGDRRAAASFTLDQLTLPVSRRVRGRRDAHAEARAPDLGRARPGAIPRAFPTRSPTRSGTSST